MEQIQTPEPNKRAKSKARSHQALIDATLEIIAEEGIGGASVSRIVEKSGLSRGMIHLHFETKEKLLVEAARSMADDYYRNLFEFIDAAPDLPAQRLIAMIDADLGESSLNAKTIAIWFAFRGAARAHNEFARYSDTRDRRLRDLFTATFAELLGNSADTPEVIDAANGTIALMEGMWADYFLHSGAFDRDAARRVVLHFIAGVLPESVGFRRIAAQSIR
ncbi:MAG TPA: TetR family transcriptional regulator C-terminal domain-containing protein [Thermohalobaculum sp.]|nr:TetR family transcriptional regulator C-terminal domain-containing protein [Thermohalobaculum sp.]